MQLLSEVEQQESKQIENVLSGSLIRNGKSLIDLRANDNYQEALEDLHQVMVKHYDDNNVKPDWRQTFPKRKGYVFNCYNGFYRLPVSSSELLKKLLISEITAMGYISHIDLWKITDEDGRVVFNTVPKGFKIRPKGNDMAEKVQFTENEGWAYYEEFNKQ